MFFDLEAYERFRLSKEEFALVKEKEDKEKEEDKQDGKKKDKKEKSEKDKKVTPLTFDLENCRDRVIRLTVNSSHLGDAVLSPDGDKLYYQASFEDGADLWVHNLKEQKDRTSAKRHRIWLDDLQ